VVVLKAGGPRPKAAGHCRQQKAVGPEMKTAGQEPEDAGQEPKTDDQRSEVAGLEPESVDQEPDCLVTGVADQELMALYVVV
jgi:hypothetical protein